MKYLLMLLITMSLNMSYGQQAMTDEEIMNQIDIFDTSPRLDDIEGIWSLAVTRTLTMSGKTYVEDEENYSEWVISRSGKQFIVRPLYEEPREEFTASFQRVSEGNYIYRCMFHKPEWGVTTKAVLVDGYKIRYTYDADPVYLKKVYGKRYKSDMILNWSFTWTRIYPKVVRT